MKQNTYSREKPHIYRQENHWKLFIACEALDADGKFLFERSRHSELNFKAIVFIERLNQK